MCGNVFKNSMKMSHLRDYVLRLKRPMPSQTPPKNSNTKLEMSSLTDTFMAAAEPLVPDQAHFYLNNRNHFHHNRHRHVKSTGSSSSSSGSINLNMSSGGGGSYIKKLYEKRTATNENNTNNNNEKKNGAEKSVKKRIVLNNCTLIMLNTYLLTYKTTCDFEDFVQILKHYDCDANNFSVNSDCKKCQVSSSVKQITNHDIICL